MACANSLYPLLSATTVDNRQYRGSVSCVGYAYFGDPDKPYATVELNAQIDFAAFSAQQWAAFTGTTLPVGSDDYVYAFQIHNRGSANPDHASAEVEYLSVGLNSEAPVSRWGDLRTLDPGGVAPRKSWRETGRAGLKFDFGSNGLLAGQYSDILFLRSDWAPGMHSSYLWGGSAISIGIGLPSPTVVPTPPALWAGLVGLGGVIAVGYWRHRRNMKTA